MAWGAFAVSAGLSLWGLGETVREGLNGTHDALSVLDQVSPIVPAGAFSVAGLLVAVRRPANPAGWLMLAIGLFWSLVVTPGSGPQTQYFSALPWVLPFGLMGTHLLLRLPDGRLLSSRWRWVSRASTVAIVATGVALPTEDNPPVTPGAIVGVVGLLALVACSLLSVASLVVRARRAGPDERHQLRWIAMGAATFFGVYALSFIPGVLGIGQSGDLGGIVLVSYAAIPAGIGIAILRYRLYDIDVVIRKAVVVAALAAFFTLVYAIVVGGVGTLVGNWSTPGLSFGAAALVAIGFQPVLARARRLADRVVYGKRATPYEVLSEFSERVRETYADDVVLQHMARVVGEGIGAAHTEVWIQVESQLHIGASWPTGASREWPAIPADGTIPAIPGADAAFPIEHKGELLGAISVATSPDDPLDEAKTRLVSELAAQAGLVLRNVRLGTELRSRLEDLQAAQRRLVAAQDEERRRIERNIHDGAQQQLVALTVKAGLIRKLMQRDPAKAMEMLTQIEEETRRALEDLRNLARGIYPPLLADKGLVAALESHGRRAALPVRVGGDGVARYPREVETAIYFSCLEALQNIAKYAHASGADVRLAWSDGRLTFEISDDGRGFDPKVTTLGTGLQGIADRLGALGGTLEVRSAPRAGTTVAGSISCQRIDEDRR